MAAAVVRVVGGVGRDITPMATVAAAVAPRPLVAAALGHAVLLLPEKGEGVHGRARAGGALAPLAPARVHVRVRV